MPTLTDAARVVVHGHNHEVVYAERTYHVQTEHGIVDAGSRITTEVFEHGRVVGRYVADLPPEGGSRILDGAWRAWLVEQVRQQHKAGLRCVLSGRLAELADDLALVLPASGVGMPTRREDPRAAGAEVERPTLLDLAVRSVLARFVRAVGETPPEPGGPTLDRFRSIVTVCALLLAHPGRHRLRQDALAEVTIRRAETVSHVRARLAGDPKASDAEGRELWRGFAEVAAGFAAANQRESFRRSDAAALREVLAHWGVTGGGRLRDDEQALVALRRCRGRDRDIDAALEDLRHLTVDDLRPTVERALAELEGGPETESPASGRNLGGKYA